MIDYAAAKRVKGGVCLLDHFQHLGGACLLGPRQLALEAGHFRWGARPDNWHLWENAKNEATMQLARTCSAR